MHGFPAQSTAVGGVSTTSTAAQRFGSGVAAPLLSPRATASDGSSWPGYAQPLLVALVDCRERVRAELVHSKTRQKLQQQAAEVITTNTSCIVRASRLPEIFALCACLAQQRRRQEQQATTKTTSDSQTATEAAGGPPRNDNVGREQATAAVNRLGNSIRAKKAAKATKAELTPLIDALKAAKLGYQVHPPCARVSSKPCMADILPHNHLARFSIA